MKNLADATNGRTWAFIALTVMCVTLICQAPSRRALAEMSDITTRLDTAREEPLPVSADEVKHTLGTLYRKFRYEEGGKVASHTEVAATANPKAFAIAIATVDGRVISVGDSRLTFPLQSLSKAFVYGLALQDNGSEAMLKNVGIHATGFPYGSLAAMEVRATKLQNPMVSAGAIAATSTIAGSNPGQKWNRTLWVLQEFVGRDVQPINTVYIAEMANNKGSHAKAWVLQSYGLLYAEPNAAVERYLRACSVGVTTEDLAIMGATLANGGVNPKTRKRVVSAEIARGQLSAMATAGMYDDSGPWLFRVGLPAKSGVSGGVVAVVPNRFAIAVYSPPLDQYGNSVRATKVIKELSDLWTLHRLHSETYR